MEKNQINRREKSYEKIKLTFKRLSTAAVHLVPQIIVRFWSSCWDGRTWRWFRYLKDATVAVLKGEWETREWVRGAEAKV